MALSNAELANLIQEYWIDLDQDRKYWRDFIAGTPNGGPNGNGTYPIPDFTGAITYIKCPARVAFESVRVPSGAPLNGTGPHTITSAQYNTKVLVYSSGVATVILPRDAPIDTTVFIRCKGSAVKVIGQSGGATIVNWQQHNASAGSNALITLNVEANSNGTSAEWVLDGTTGVAA